ncbi:MAG: glucose-6-phosphate isomerase [Bacteroidales bacterium]|nr:glucose-6-phosphate isomerase [Bacteroidales bacterium]MBQ2599104.1 glucose-6-phosphate isomerase [Bacteroidales bacterium]
MVKIDLSGCDSFVAKERFEEYVKKALAAQQVLEDETGAGNDFLGWQHLPSAIGKEQLDDCLGVVDRWIEKEVDLVVVIGIGGSYLGAKAAIEALSHSFSSLLGLQGPKVVFAGENLSEDYTAELLDLLQTRNAACVVISKSGTTTEPAVAFRLVKQHLEDTYGKEEACSRIVAITDKVRGALKSLANQEGYKTFIIEDNIGGRFSVLTPVGLVPIALAGFDIEAMVRGAKDAEKALADRSADNPAVRYAAMRNLLYAQGKKVELFASFHPKMQYLGEWLKQLFGESEGKDGKGIFPASVIFTTDLHSMGQYIQDGERMLFETVITVENAQREVSIPRDEQDLDGLNYLAGKRVEHCNRMAQLGTRMAHIDGGVPNIDIRIEQLDEYHLGQLFYFFEKVCGISAYVLGVNPFNQPGVEAYKKNMFKLLEKPGY